MRILFLALDIDLSRQRGDTTHAVELATAFQELGHKVTFVVGSGDPKKADVSSNLSVRILKGGDRTILSGVKEILRAFPADVVYERRSTPKIGFAIRSRWSLPVVMEINGILREELAAQGRDPGAVLTQGVKATLRRAMFKRIDRFVVVGQAIADDLVATCRVDPSRIRVIGNGVSTERFKPMEKTEACGRLQLDPTRARLIFVGNLVGWRDFDTLLSATTLSARNVPGLELVLVGDGAERRRLEEAASHLPPSTVLFAGEVPHAQVPNYIGSSDICLLPERARGLDISPLKLFEYMSCKRPIVAFAVKGLELVETLGVGVLVRPNEPDMLSEALVSLLNDPVRRKEMGDRARTFVERERTWRRVASEISKVLDEAVGVAS